MTKLNKKIVPDINGKYSVLSFFSGCGGLDLGFLGGFLYKDIEVPELPFNIIASYDNDAKCVQTYTDNISSHAEIKDLSDFDLEDAPFAQVLIGGFPCQDFSTCGPRNGLSSNRGMLYKTLVEYMEVHKPPIVIGENVPGLANMQKGAVLEIITEDMKIPGYKVKVWTLFAPDYGIPQRRTRLFIVAVRNDLPGFPEKPSKSFGMDTYRTAKWAIEDLENVSDESVSNQSQYFKASKAKNGNGQGDETTPANAPSYTIRANAKSRIQFHYSLDRRLTVRECARLQTFPDKFHFPHSATTNIMQIGNAVPPLLGNIVAKSIADYLESIYEH
jgi:DNA (cytosine-5)-methyltransferase 1